MAGNEFRAVETSHQRFAVQIKERSGLRKVWLALSFHDTEEGAIAEAQACKLAQDKEDTEKVINIVWPRDGGW